MIELITEKTIDSFFMQVGACLEDKDNRDCYFLDYESATESYKKWANEIGAFDVQKTREIASVCTRSFFDAYKRYITNTVRKMPLNGSMAASIQITIQAQRALADYCRENKCDHSTAILSVFSPDAKAPILSESDTKIADQVVNALYEKIGRRLLRIEETMHLIDMPSESAPSGPF